MSPDFARPDTSRDSAAPQAISPGTEALAETRLLETPSPPARTQAGAEPADPAAQHLPAGTALLRGQYRISRFLGAGGFGITYLAEDSLGRSVVLKECFPREFCRRNGLSVETRPGVDRPSFLQLVEHFQNEARRLAHLRHPNIVGVHQVFADNGTSYFALDLVQGHSLLDVIQGKAPPLTPDQTRDLLLTLLGALDYLHARAILHRDIAPDNILIGQDGRPVLIDFGAAQGDIGPGQISHSSLNTVKDGYSPLEFYIQGRPQGPGSDLYALAASFYHLITGRRPPDALTRIAAVSEGYPDPYEKLTDFDRRFDRWFVAALNQAMALFSPDRPASAADWTAQIHEVRRREAARLKAFEDQKIEASVQRLVAGTRSAPAALPPEPQAAEPAASAPPETGTELPGPAAALRDAPLPPPLILPPAPRSFGQWLRQLLENRRRKGFDKDFRSH